MFMFGWVGSALASCAATCACHACSFASREVMRKSARLAYCVLFTLAMALSWVLRDFAKPVLEKLPCESFHFPFLPAWSRPQFAWNIELLSCTRGPKQHWLPCRDRAQRRQQPAQPRVVWAAGCVPRQHGQLREPLSPLLFLRD